MKKSRRKSTSTLNAQRAAAGRKSRGRGVDFQLRGPIRVKGDPDLQKRIELVVAMAKAKDARSADHSVDVMNQSSTFRFRSSGLKVTRVG
jgi:hypothetical protein